MKENKDYFILVGCEESQAVTIAFRELGYSAFSCDLQPCSGGHEEWHLQMSVFDAIKLRKWDLGIFHPPCTYLTVTANTWLKDQPKRKSGKLVGEERRNAKKEAETFFLALLNSDIPKIAIENPIGSINSIIKPTQIVHPYYFGDPVSKSTCLWLKGLPGLLHIDQNCLFGDRTHVKANFYTTKTGKKYPEWSMIEAAKIKDLNERTKFRSKTFNGIARAMASQWSQCLK